MMRVEVRSWNGLPRASTPVTVSGTAAEEFLNYVLTNDVRKLAPGEGQYTLMCNEQGVTNPSQSGQRSIRV